MKFIKLESRGGNYLVVASNVAWLRTAENGQTNVGIVGGQPLLVVGSIEEVAEKILAGLAGGDESAAPAAAAPPPAVAQAPAPAPAPAQPAPEQQPAPVAAAPEPEPEPQGEAEPEPAAPRPTPPAPPARPRVASARSASMWERPAAAAQNLKIKAGSQRMMGRLD
jgi:outer membrane biosynthesis protein TonB